jgi:hypothetical protein
MAAARSTGTSRCLPGTGWFASSTGAEVPALCGGVESQGSSSSSSSSNKRGHKQVAGRH